MHNILITGGLGFIGSHTIIELLKYDYNIIIIDNLSNSNHDIIEKIKIISNSNNIKLYIGDILDLNLLNEIFISFVIYSVIHFAGLKSVNDSISEPLKYYENNVSGTINLLNVMKKYNIKNFIFSSSATVYGNTKAPFNENSQTGINITNPYGKSKYLIEEILKDLHDWNIYCLRYFNPIGCHESGLIGDDPNGIPNNIIPYILKVVSGKIPYLNIYGNDYNTIDGTGVRDYIHVVDLAKAHVKAIENLKCGFNVINLGTGNGTSVLELVNQFEKINNIKIPYKLSERREGDVDISYCDTSKAEYFLNWKAEKTISDMCKDSCNFINKTL
jgi:UDP-glucose 4-epimerase